MTYPETISLPHLPVDLLAVIPEDDLADEQNTQVLALTTSKTTRTPSYIQTETGPLHRCCDCQRWLPADAEHFVTERRSRFGLGALCLGCNSARASQWRKSKPALADAQRQRRRKRDKAADGKFTAADKEVLLAMYGHHCLRCGQHESVCGPLIADHVTPPPAGSHDIANRQPLCGPCNKRKSSSSMDYRPMWANSLRIAA